MIELRTAVSETLAMLVTTLDAHGIAYQITGGLAGNLHGSEWPLHDIDLEVAGPLDQVATLFEPYVVWGPARYSDAEFDLDLLRLEIQGVEVDINSIEDSYVLSGGASVRVETDLRRSVTTSVGALLVKVQPLEALIR